MELIVQTTAQVHGIIQVPSSKSQTIRAIFIALLARGESTLFNVLDSEDTQNAISICRQLGATINVQDTTVKLKSTGVPLIPISENFYSGNSGITTHFVLPILGLRNTQTPVMLDCGEQMRARPILPLVDALTPLGLKFKFLKAPNQLPVSMSGTLCGGETQVSGITSQYLSALLLTLPCAQENSVIHVKDLSERPYVEMTLGWLRQQEISIAHETKANNDIYYITGQKNYRAFTTTISGDFSSASYFIAAACLLPSQVEFHGLDMQEAQGDKQLISILQQMGADISVTDKKIYIRGGRKLHGIRIDANDIPDLLPTLAVIGTKAIGKMEIINVANARIKETDRLQSMSDGLKRLGAKIETYQDRMIIHCSSLQGNVVDGYNDHRTIMALALAGLIAQGQTVIKEAQGFKKTFPTFITSMHALGAKMELK
jgi:3-phosphoshikimate 1-carboxyvinyltransferase